METYSSAPADLKFNNIQEFAEKVDIILNYKNRQKYYKSIDTLRSIGLKRVLELPENIGCHLEALNTPYGSSERVFLKKWN